MTIEQLDALFGYFYNLGERTSTFNNIREGCFEGDRSIDLTGLLRKMERDGYLDLGLFTIPFVQGEVTTYKLSFEGRFLFENGLVWGRPYHSLQISQRRKIMYDRFKTIAIVANAIAIIAIAVWAVLIQRDANDLERGKNKSPTTISP